MPVTVTHCVFLRLRESVNADALFAELAGLKDLIEGIVSFSGGPTTSSENLGHFTHAFVMVFASVAARDAYLPHPEHIRVKTAVVAALHEDAAGAVAVVDYAS